MKKLKRVIKQIPIINLLAVEVNNYLFPKIHVPAYWIGRYIKNSNCDIVQIGSNDGKTGDPIFNLIMTKTKWNAVLVEPVPYLFKKLQKNYPALPRLRFENAAINEGSKQIFYYVNIEDPEKVKHFPHWYDQLGSFNRANIINHLDGMLDPYIEEMEVTGLTLDQLFIRNGIKNLKMLHIDTEGYDWKILSQLDLKKHKPTILFFEHKHLSETELAEANQFLEPDFHVFRFDSDFLCLRKDMLKKRDFNKLTDLAKSQS